MTTEQLSLNRYGQKTPNYLLPNGITIACPVYFNLPMDTAKGLLNAFREQKLRELVELGWEDTQAVNGTALTVTTAKTPPMTPVEQAMGMTEESLRFALFSRQGIQERLILKLQKLLDIELVTRDQIEQTYKLWLNEFEFKAKTKRTTKTTSTRAKQAAV